MASTINRCNAAQVYAWPLFVERETLLGKPVCVCSKKVPSAAYLSALMFERCVHNIAQARPGCLQPTPGFVWKPATLFVQLTRPAEDPTLMGLSLVSFLLGSLYPRSFADLPGCSPEAQESSPTLIVPATNPNRSKQSELHEMGSTGTTEFDALFVVEDLEDRVKNWSSSNAHVTFWESSHRAHQAPSRWKRQG